MSNPVPPRKSSFQMAVPAGDDRPRLVCDHCDHVHYENPKIVVGSVATWEDRVLLCRRAIQPRAGFWTIPAGYLEERESTAHGAAREAMEEAGADLEIGPLLAVYDVEHISQVQIIYRARLRSPTVAAGRESREVALFRWDEIPWDELAFPSVDWALRHFDAVRDVAVFTPFGTPP